MANPWVQQLVVICLAAVNWLYLSTSSAARHHPSTSQHHADNGVAMTSSDKSATLYIGSQCFRVPGVPTLRLWCPPAPDGGPQLVRVIQAFYGVPPSNTTCGYRPGAGHCVQLTDLPAGVQCSGRYHCTIHVSNPYLMSCRAYAVYMQVNYTCVPKSSSLDVCSTSTVVTTHGYLRSPNYPEAEYSGRQRCLCRLRAASRIIFRLLDLSTATDVDAADRDSCPASSSDVVRVAAAEGSLSRRYCGRLESDRLPETFDTRRADAVVEFQTNGRRRDHGFWLAYTSSDGGKVKVSCASRWYRQPRNRVRSPSTTPTVVTSRLSTSDMVTSSTTSARPLLAKESQRHVTSDNDGDMSRPRTLERPPLHDDDDSRPLRRTRTRLNTVQHWVKYSSDDVVGGGQTGQTVYRELADDDFPELHETEQHHRLAGGPSDAVFHVYHSDDLEDDAELSVEDPEAARRSATATAALDGTEPRPSRLTEFAELATQRPSDDHSDDFRRARQDLKYNVEEVQIITGVVVGVLLLAATIVVVIVVYRKSGGKLNG